MTPTIPAMNLLLRNATNWLAAAIDHGKTSAQ
jgi:hypothetical protein